LREKVRQGMELRRLQLPLMARQRPLQPWERPWDIEPQASRVSPQSSAGALQVTGPVRLLSDESERAVHD
jgi:hypothetical protein